MATQTEVKSPLQKYVHPPETQEKSKYYFLFGQEDKTKAVQSTMRT